MKEDASINSFNVASWAFIILLLIFNWGALDWGDLPDLFRNRKELFVEKAIYTLPLNLSFGFAFILATSVKRYTKWHFLANTMFFTIITTIFNAKGWLKPAVKIRDSGTVYTRTYHLLLEYFDHFGLFDFLSALLIAVYLTYYWHIKILGVEEDFEE